MFFSPWALRLLRLGSREIILVLFVRLFDLLHSSVGFNCNFLTLADERDMDMLRAMSSRLINVIDIEWLWPTFSHRYALRTTVVLLYVLIFYFVYFFFRANKTTFHETIYVSYCPEKKNINENILMSSVQFCLAPWWIIHICLSRAMRKRVF